MLSTSVQQQQNHLELEFKPFTFFPRLFVIARGAVECFQTKMSTITHFFALVGILLCSTLIDAVALRMSKPEQTTNDAALTLKNCLEKFNLNDPDVKMNILTNGWITMAKMDRVNFLKRISVLEKRNY